MREYWTNPFLADDVGIVFENCHLKWSLAGFMLQTLFSPKTKRSKPNKLDTVKFFDLFIWWIRRNLRYKLCICISLEEVCNWITIKAFLDAQEIISHDLLFPCIIYKTMACHRLQAKFIVLRIDFDAKSKMPFALIIVKVMAKNRVILHGTDRSGNKCAMKVVGYLSILVTQIMYYDIAWLLM